MPPWAVEGAAVTVCDEQEDGTRLDGVILRANVDSCTVRLPRRGGGALSGEDLTVEQVVATPRLLPVIPKVGANVKVVAGDRSGCHGTLVGLAGPKGVVQIGGLSYETLPMSQLVVVAV